MTASRNYRVHSIIRFCSLCIVLNLFLFYLYIYNTTYVPIDSPLMQMKPINNNWRNFSNNEIRSLSVLGRRLFYDDLTSKQQMRQFTIHVWKHYDQIKSRFMKRFTDVEYDPFEDCSVNNCIITHEDEKVTQADAVMFHMHRLSGPPSDVPRVPNQLWVWMADESPYGYMMVAKDKNIHHYNGYFNWSMTYRMDSDVPVPYGRTVLLPVDQQGEEYTDMYQRKPLNISHMGSYCSGNNNRIKYIKELQKSIHVDRYGSCGTLKCPGHFRKDCLSLNQYKFYLAFENSNCDEYITEKAWWNALGKGSVPIVMGPPKDQYIRALPPNSFIHVDDYETPKKLAEYLQYLLSNSVAYNKYHEWRKEYRVLNEHGYFQSPVYHFCRLCEALNYNSRDGPQKADHAPYFDKHQHCYEPIHPLSR